MQKSDLANILRKRQIERGILKKMFNAAGCMVSDEYIRESVNNSSDDQVIDDYIKCPNCEKRDVTEKELTIIISMATDVESFFYMLDNKESFQNICN